MKMSKMPDESSRIDVDYLEYKRAMVFVMNDRGLMTIDGARDYFRMFGEVGAIILGENGKISATRIRDGIILDERIIYFRTFELAQESMIIHSREWSTIAKWEAQRSGHNQERSK